MFTMLIAMMLNFIGPTQATTTSTTVVSDTSDATLKQTKTTITWSRTTKYEIRR